MQEIRQRLRKRRREISPEIQDICANHLLEQFLLYFSLKKFQQIAAYFAFEGEINPALIVEHLWSMQKKVYMPVLNDNSKTMQFAKYQKNTVLKPNRFGIPEPLTDERLSAQSLDLILLPLVAFDKKGNRLGMGAGFYDATLKLLKSKPRLIGLGYDFQCVDHITNKESDVMLDGILTEKGYYEILAA